MLKIRGTAISAGAILCVLEAAIGPPASALDRHIEFINDTRMAIVEIYASPVGVGRWGQDLLGDGILPPASSIRISIDGGMGYCRIDPKPYSTTEPLTSAGTSMSAPSNAMRSPIDEPSGQIGLALASGR